MKFTSYEYLWINPGPIHIQLSQCDLPDSFETGRGIAITSVGVECKQREADMSHSNRKRAKSDVEKPIWLEGNIGGANRNRGGKSRELAGRGHILKSGLPGPRGFFSNQGSNAPIRGNRNWAPPLIGTVHLKRTACRDQLRSTHAKDKKGGTMSAKPMTVFCFFPHRTSLEHAVSALQLAGFRDEDISVLFQAEPLVEGLAAGIPAMGVEEPVPYSGSASVIGPMLGRLAEPLTMSIPGEGTFQIIGPLASTLVSVGAFHKPGGLVEALLASGLPENEVNQYRIRIKKGDILFCINCPLLSHLRKAEVLLESTGAESICATRNGVSE
ncbi:MAG: hypothetical protein LAO19_00450 [Acidobacteriia bacterium]|nr:hypothetical protein [Terriglobia bacterium]